MVKKPQKKLVKQTEVPSGHDSANYVVERIKAKSHDGQMIPISLVRLKTAKQDGKSKTVSLHIAQNIFLNPSFMLKHTELQKANFSNGNKNGNRVLQYC